MGCSPCFFYNFQICGFIRSIFFGRGIHLLNLDDIFPYNPAGQWGTGIVTLDNPRGTTPYVFFIGVEINQKNIRSLSIH